MSVSGRTAVVTGGGTGIGAAVALSLAQAGCRTAICGRREAPLRATAAEFVGEPAILCRPCDVADRGDVEAFFAWANESLGRIDLLIHCAGINVPRRAMADLDPADWDQVLRANATGAYDCVRSVLPGMRARQDGLIVLISSIAGIRASVLGGVAYSASKFAMSALGLTVGIEERTNGIRVTNIYPGEVDTPILEQRPVPVTAEHRARILRPEDVAAAVLMVADLPPRAHVPELVITPTSQPFA